MDPLTLAAIMGAAGLAKSEFIDRPREERQRKVAAETMRWSPWTGMMPGGIKEADPFGSALQGGLAGAMIGQANQGADAAKAKDVAEVSLAGGAPPQTAQEVLSADELAQAQTQSTMSPLQRQELLMRQRSPWYGQ